MEIDRCEIRHEESDAEDQDDVKEKPEKGSEDDELIQSSAVSIPTIHATESTFSTAFQLFLTKELQSIKKGLNSLNKKFDRIEKKTDIIFEMAAESRVINALNSLGMTGVEGLSSEFYHYQEYREPLNSLAHHLNDDYRARWAIYNQYVDISLAPQTVEMNLMGEFEILIVSKEHGWQERKSKLSWEKPQWF